MSADSANETNQPAGCVRCGHLIGYHWPEDEHCTAKDCTCSAYVDSDPPLPKSKLINRPTSLGS